MRESAVEKYFIKKAKQRGYVQYKNSPDFYAGIPDRTLMFYDPKIHACRGILVELKTEGGRTSPLQKLVHEELREAGVRVEVLWTKEQVDDFYATL